MKRRLVLNTLLNALGTGWGFLISLTLTPFLIHVLGREAYGTWILVTSFSVVSGYLSLLDFGFQTSIVKFVAEHYARGETDALHQVIGAGLYLFAILGAVAAVALFLFAQLFLTQVFSIPPDLAGVTRLLLDLLAVQVLFEFPGLIFSGILEGLQRYDLLRGIEITRLGLYALILVVLLLGGYGLIALGITTLFIAMIRTLVLGWLTWRLLPGLRLPTKIPSRVLRRIASFSGQIFVLRINAVVFNQMDKAIIGALLVSTLLTDYDIANKIQNLVLASLTFTSSLMVPAASQLHALNDKVRLQELFLKGTKYTLAICLPIGVSAFVLAPSLITVWIGSDYAYDATITRLFVSYLFLTPAVVVGYNMMIGMGLVRPLLWIQIITTGINLAVSIVLTPRIGVAGVICGTLVGTTLASIPYLRHSLRAMGVPWGLYWRRSLVPTYPLAIALGILLYVGDRWFGPRNLWVLGTLELVALAIYGVLFAWFSLDADERKTFLGVAALKIELRKSE